MTSSDPADHAFFIIKDCFKLIQQKRWIKEDTQSDSACKLMYSLLFPKDDEKS